MGHGGVPAGLAHRPEIDGLRALAVLPVILFHAGAPGFGGGFVGVDVFFVISGYLITSIILKDLAAGRFSFFRFYARRTLRILPALTLVVLLCVPAAWAMMLPGEFRDFAQSVAAVGVFASNVLFWLESGYFAAAAEQKPLLHTWSLAVEEQYYLGFPVLMLALWRWRGAAIPVALAALLAASLALSEWAWRTHPDANFYLIPTRAWELMIGSLGSVLAARAGRPLNAPLAAAGVALILGSIVGFDDATPFPSLHALVPTVGTLLVLLCAEERRGPGRLLASWPFVAVGLISYSAYLWHQPLMAFARVTTVGHPPLPLMLGLGAASLGLAWVSWRFVEQPFRRLSAAPRLVVVGGLVVSAALAVLGVGLATSDLQRRSFVAGLSADRAETLRRIERNAVEGLAAADDGACRFGIAAPDDAAAARIADCAARHGPGLAVVGDSHSVDLHNALIAADGPAFLVQIDKGADCSPYADPAACEGGQVAAFLRRNAAALDRLLYHQAGFWLLRPEPGTTGGRAIFQTGAPPVATVDVAAAANAATYVAGLAQRTGLPVLWIGPRLEPHVAMETLLGFSCDAAPTALRLQDGLPALFAELDAAAADAARAAGISYLSLQDAVGFDVARDVMDCDAVYWMDGDHWSAAGEHRFGDRVGPALNARIGR